MRLFSSPVTRLAPLLAATLLATAAHAAAPSQTGPNGVGLDMRFGSASGATTDLFHFQPTLFGSYWVAPKIRLSGAWGVAYSSVSSTTSSSDSNTAFSNLVLGAHYLLLDGGARVTAGGAVGIPILSAPTGVTDAATFGVNDMAAMSVRGRLGDPLWAPDTITFFVPVRASVKFTSGLWLRADLDVDVYVPTDQGDTNLGSLLALDVAYRAGGFIPGARLTADWQFTQDGDNFQSAVELYLRVNYTWGFARLGFLMNLDAPLGSSFDDGKLWGAGLRAAYKL